MGKKGNNKIKTVIIILAVLLSLSLVALAGTIIYNKSVINTGAAATVSDNLITSDEDKTGSTTEEVQSTHSGARPNKNTAAAEISLYNKHLQDNTVFSVGNMFPGDSETKRYRVRVSYHDKITVHFKAQTHSGEKNAAEVMGVKVKLIASDETLYDGLIRDMPQSITYTMASPHSTTDEIYYEITAFLDTSAGNEYQGRKVIIDFSWWVEEAGNLDKPPQTGDVFNTSLWLTVEVISAALCIVLLVFRKKEEGKQNG